MSRPPKPQQKQPNQHQTSMTSTGERSSGRSNVQLPKLSASNFDYNTKNLFHVNINASNVNTSKSSNRPPLPPIKSIKQPEPRGFKFNRTFLIIPVIAFLVVAIIAAIFGVIFGVLYQPDFSYQQSNNNINIKVNNTVILTTSKPTIKSPDENTATTLPPTELRPTVCGIQPVRPNFSQLRIIRGNEAIEHSWPWAVSIGYTGPRTTIQHVCGGALINKRTVVTATHCVEAASVYALVGAADPNNPQYESVTSMLRIYVGVNTRSTDINEKTTYRAARVISHPGFDQSSYKNDITIITLDRDVEESATTGFLCVEETTQTQPGTKVYAVGWGFTEKNWYKASDKLMQISFPIKTRQNCGLGYIPVFQFCAGDHVLGKDTCNGDSGGPLMTYVNDRFVLTGVVSNGDSACTGKGIYTNVAVYYNWIMSNSNY